MSARAAAQYGRVLPAAALLVGLIGLLGLGRQFPAAADSPGLLIPFLMPILALALEAGALVALSASALPLLRQPSASFRTRGRAVLTLFGLLLMTLALAELMPRGTERPGALANDLVARAQAGCDEGTASVPVPLLGLTVRCSSPPRVEGPMPGVASIQLGMRELRFSDDLRSVYIADLDLSAKRALTVKLRVSSARIVGLAPWARSPRLAPLVRFFVLLAIGTALLLAVVVLWAARSPDRGSPGAVSTGAAKESRRWWLRLADTLLCAAPGATQAALVIAFDQQQATLIKYGLSALSGVVVLLGLRLLARRTPRLFGPGGAF